MNIFLNIAELSHRNNDETHDNADEINGYAYADFMTFYQPIVELTSGKISGYEALARRRTLDGSFVSAGQLFSDKQLPRDKKLFLDRHLRKLALNETSESPDAGFITLNISPDWVDLLGDDYHIPTLEMIKQSGIDPDRVIVEITEHCGSLENLKRLTKSYHRAGLKVAIDDFGAGASQIDRVIELEPDFIKLDMELFKSAAAGGYAADVVLSIVAMAQRAGCKIICEGVETQAQLNFAIECGADYIQGWLFSPALPGPIESEAFSSQLTDMKSAYLNEKSLRYAQAARHNKKVAETLVSLCEGLSSRQPLKSITQRMTFSEAKELGVLQLFLCDSQGNQVSENVTYTDDQVGFDSSFLGNNWSHRPYFPLLHAMNQVQSNHIVVSTPYRDINSGKLCKTHGVFVSSDRVLLIDVLADDVILFDLGD